MKMINNDKAAKMVKFETLRVGDGYVDENGLLCVKTSCYNDYENCICYADGSWGACYQSACDLVMPIKITLTAEQ